ncbi:MAG: glycosyltransferase [Bacteroidaceae bacterium]|nr:glycosyltransferase [Bacteroidaceae bacterium]
MAYLRYLSEKEIETNVLFFSSNNDGIVMPSMVNIRVENIWKKYLFKRGVLRYLSIFFNLLRFKKRLKRGDVVYCYENVNYWKLFLKKGVRVYSEYTENPDVIGLGGKFLYTSKAQFKKACKKLSGLFVISTSLKEYFVKLGVKENNIHIINIIVDGNRFKGIEKKVDVEPYIAYCGSAYNNKDGVDQLIKAFAITHKVHTDIKLYIIGESPKKDQECSNMKLAYDLGVKDDVVFTGLVPAEKIPQMLMNAQMLVLDRPRNVQAQYGFPTKLGEYLLTGNPTVLTNVGDMRLFLEDKVSAIFAEPDNPEDFAEKMNWCIENPDESMLIGQRGKVVALKHFNYTTETRKMVEIMLKNH